MVERLNAPKEVLDQQRRSAIKSLRMEGKNNPEIAQDLGIPVVQVGKATHELIKRGEIKPLSCASPETRILYRQVKELKVYGYTYDQIREIMGVPAWRISQARHWLLKTGEVKSDHPGTKTRDNLLALLQQFADENPNKKVNLSELATKLKVSRSRAHQLYNELASEHNLPPKTNKKRAS